MGRMTFYSTGQICSTMPYDGVTMYSTMGAEHIPAPVQMPAQGTRRAMVLALGAVIPLAPGPPGGTQSEDMRALAVLRFGDLRLTVTRVDVDRARDFLDVTSLGAQEHTYIPGLRRAEFKLYGTMVLDGPLVFPETFQFDETVGGCRVQATLAIAEWQQLTTAGGGEMGFSMRCVAIGPTTVSEAAPAEPALPDGVRAMQFAPQPQP